MATVTGRRPWSTTSGAPLFLAGPMKSWMLTVEIAKLMLFVSVSTPLTAAGGALHWDDVAGYLASRPQGD